MKKAIYILASVFFLAFIPKENETQVDVQITSSSTLYIKGTSNVNTFTCHFNTAELERKASVSYGINGMIMSFKNARMQLENNGFDCGGKMINKDFHELLKSDEHPHIYLELLKLIKHDYGYTAYVVIEIAGNKVDYAISVNHTSDSGKYSGKMDVNITDFGLTPPKKMMGMIVVREEIEINFDFDIRIL